MIPEAGPPGSSGRMGQAIGLAGQSGLPTGSVGAPPRMVLTTMAAEAYQATIAVTTPTMPPILMTLVLLAKKPMNRTISVASRVRNTANIAQFNSVLHSSM